MLARAAALTEGHALGADLQVPFLGPRSSSSEVMATGRQVFPSQKSVQGLGVGVGGTCHPNERK